MLKGVDYTGVSISFYCHDGAGNFVIHKRSTACRDEWGCWDFGGGGLRFGERLEECVVREVFEEYGTKPLSIEFMGSDEVFRVHEGKNTHWISFRYKVLVDRSEVHNNEPEKHDELVWVRLDNLPTPLHSQVIPALQKYQGVLEQ